MNIEELLIFGVLFNLVISISYLDTGVENIKTEMNAVSFNITEIMKSQVNEDGSGDNNVLDVIYELTIGNAKRISKAVLEILNMLFLGIDFDDTGNGLTTNGEKAIMNGIGIIRGFMNAIIFITFYRFVKNKSG